MSVKLLCRILGSFGILAGCLLIIRPAGDLLGLDTNQLSRAPVHTFLLPGIVIALGYGLVPLYLAHSSQPLGRRLGIYLCAAAGWIIIDMVLFQVFDWLQVCFLLLLVATGLQALQKTS